MLLITIPSIDSSIRIIDDCQLLIVGGTTSALGAIISASKFLNSRTCLLEPTDWIGGQLTAELLSAPDFAWHTIRDTDNFTLNVRAIDQQLNNQNPLFSEMLAVLGNTGGCHVSPSCSIPSLFHFQAVLPQVNNTRIYYNTVIKRVKKDVSGRRITQIDAIQRTSQQTEERCRFLSEELPDWYSPNDSAWFTKTELSFTNLSFVIEGTSWGEVLVLSNASYLQGLMEQFDGDISCIGNSTCGQAFTIGFLEQLREIPVDEPPNPLPEPTGGTNHSFGRYTWEWVWTDRRVNTSALNSSTIAVNDITIQNWGGGNDYGKEFFYLSPSDAQHQRDTNHWEGGVNLNAIQNAERQAYSYHYWYREKAPAQWANRTVLIRSSSLTGTCHYLAKLPYMRESRRSIGYQNFLMNITTIRGRARDLHGYIFDDRMCIGAHDADFHRMAKCIYPSYMKKYYPILPYYIPLRAMTNRDIDNLIPIGKTMAQSFLVNSAVRLHPVEFSIGQAAGVIGTYAVQNNLLSVAEMLKEEHLSRVQSIVKQFTPISWTIDGKCYPDD
ncbi:unnamed protein product [Rotaria sordida]|uniref:FAD dependent oxidoreductase n=2 Tax=Rotaria sordida TaxID=392033 RepID=A0A815KRB7_9BILA|nr:unnamed protein product [Rotaria sordida]CAF4116634.1 unnamed protein product [Rotaria sordida]